jgi:hypothetical protein
MIFTHNRLKGSVHYHPLQSPQLDVPYAQPPPGEEGALLSLGFCWLCFLLQLVDSQSIEGYSYQGQPLFQEPPATTPGSVGGDAGQSDNDKY